LSAGANSHHDADRNAELDRDERSDSYGDRNAELHLNIYRNSVLNAVLFTQFDRDAYRHLDSDRDGKCYLNANGNANINGYTNSNLRHRK
jgi:hypothetical protein